MRFVLPVLPVLVLLCAACDGGAAAVDSGPGPRPGVDAGPPRVGGDAGPPVGAADAGPPASGSDAGPPAPGVDAGPGSTGGGCGRDPGANDRRWTLTHDGRERTFVVHVPPGYSPSAATPVVLNFHGRMSSASQQIVLSEMNAAADRHGFVAVHPEGVGATWNGGLCCGTAMSQDVDDVGFTRAMIDRLASELCVDERRVFATGLSNGGYMSHRLACELADRIAAIGPVAGPNATTSCAPSRPVPVMHFHGTGDRIVPYDGFAGQLSVRATMEDWARRNGCSAGPTTYFTNGDARCEEWTGCQADATVRLCTIDGGGHQWPGGNSIPFLGPNTNDISATEAMWEFFVAHPRP